MTDDICFAGLAETAGAIRAGKWTAKEVAAAAMARIEAREHELHALFHFDADLLMAQAEAADAARAAGAPLGPLHGVPIGLKDLVETADMPTSGGNPFLIGRKTGRDATVTRRFREAGALIAGKLATPQGAWADYPEPFIFPKNPWDAAYWPGNSSTGSGVAVAAGYVQGAIGTETGGSMRLPCAVNGVTGLKPTWGRISRAGVMELAGTLDHVCPMARSARDVALMLQVLAGPDADDPTAAHMTVPDYAAALDADLRGLKLGIDRDWIGKGTDAATVAMIEEAIAVLTGLGMEPVEVTLPDYPEVVDDWTLLCSVQSALANAEWYPAHAGQYGPAIAGVIEGASGVSAGRYQKALTRRAAFRGRLHAMMAGLAGFISPITCYSDLTLDFYDQQIAKGDFIGMLMEFNCPFSMAQTPLLALPGAMGRGNTPMGFQMVGGAFREAELLTIGAAFQRESDWHARRPSFPQT